MDWKSTATRLHMLIIIKGNHRSTCTFYRSILTYITLNQYAILPQTTAFVWISFRIYDDNKCMGDDNKCMGDDNKCMGDNNKCGDDN